MTTHTTAQRLRTVAKYTGLNELVELLNDAAAVIDQAAADAATARDQAVQEAIARLEQGFGANSAPVFVLREHFTANKPGAVDA